MKMKGDIMKKNQPQSWCCIRIAMIAILLGVTVSMRSEDRLYISDFSIEPGETKEIAIQFDCSEEKYVGFQFNIQLPEGLIPVFDEDYEDYFRFNSERGRTHSITSAMQADGSIKAIGVSTKNSLIKSTTGDLAYLTVNAAEDFAGIHEIKLTNIRFSDNMGLETLLTDQSYGFAQSGTVGVRITISRDNKLGTCVLPFDVELPEGLQAYSARGIKDDCLELKESTSLKAYTPYILYAKNGFDQELTGFVSDEFVSVVTGDGLLYGAIIEQTITTGFILQNKNKGDGVMFYKIDEEPFKIPAGKCWLEIPNTLNLVTIRMSFGTAGVENVETDELPEDESVYGLDGKRVLNPEKGRIYIVGGKKVLKM